MECQYCQIYYDSETRIGSSRFCEVLRRMRSADQKVCDEVKLTKIFWCKKSDHWIDLTACSSHQRKADTECDHCTQSHHLLELRKMIGRRNMNPTIKPEHKVVLLKKKGERNGREEVKEDRT